jgi:hypothetical protein
MPSTHQRAAFIFLSITDEIIDSGFTGYVQTSVHSHKQYTTELFLTGMQGMPFGKKMKRSSSSSRKLSEKKMPWF